MWKHHAPENHLWSKAYVKGCQRVDPSNPEKGFYIAVSPAEYQAAMSATIRPDEPAAKRVKPSVIASCNSSVLCAPLAIKTNAPSAVKTNTSTNTSTTSATTAIKPNTSTTRVPNKPSEPSPSRRLVKITEKYAISFESFKTLPTLPPLPSTNSSEYLPELTDQMLNPTVGHQVYAAMPDPAKTICRANEWLCTDAVHNVIQHLVAKYSMNTHRVYVVSPVVTMVMLSQDSDWLGPLVPLFTDTRNYSKMMFVYIYNNHYAVVIAHFGEDMDGYRHLIHYDSIPRKDVPDIVETRIPILLKNLIHRDTGITIDETKFIVTETRQFNQRNGTDCGIYALKIVDAFLQYGQIVPVQMNAVKSNGYYTYSSKDITKWRAEWGKIS